MSSLSAFASFLILFVSVTALFAGYVKHRSLRALNNPPGPKGLPFLGNVLEINSSEPWLTFTRWASSYGLLICPEDCDSHAHSFSRKPGLLYSVQKTDSYHSDHGRRQSAA